MDDPQTAPDLWKRLLLAAGNIVDSRRRADLMRTTCGLTLSQDIKSHTGTPPASYRPDSSGTTSAPRLPPELRYPHPGGGGACRRLHDGGMFTEPVDPDLTPEQAQELDDDLFSSRPLEYFSARIASLLADLSAAEVYPAAGREFARRLGLTRPDEILAFTSDDRALQVAMDSLVLRHHVAEALVRLYHALAVPPAANRASCLWQRLADGPRTTVSLVDAVLAHLTSEAGHGQFPGLVLPPDTALDEDAVTALNVMQDWSQPLGGLGDVSLNVHRPVASSVR
ncbi:MAG: hypothetical protein ACJ71T_12775 [Actinomycetales bacterium]